MSDLNPLYALLIMLAVAVGDYLWTIYINYVSAKRPHMAALAGTAIYMFGAFNVVSYTSNHWYLVPAVVGGYLGTWFAVKRSDK